MPIIPTRPDPLEVEVVGTAPFCTPTAHDVATVVAVRDGARQVVVLDAPGGDVELTPEAAVELGCLLVAAATRARAV